MGGDLNGVINLKINVFIWTLYYSNAILSLEGVILLDDKMVDLDIIRIVINQHFDYGTDPYSEEVYKKNKDKIKDNELYLVPSKALRRYIDNYINRKFEEKHGREPITDEEKNSIIKKEGATKGQKYDITAILKMLEDEQIKKLIQKRLEDKTYIGKHLLGYTFRIPNYVQEYYNKINELNFNTNEEIEFYNQVKDFSDEELEMMLNVIMKIKHRKEDMIIKMYNREYKDISDMVNSERY